MKKINCIAILILLGSLFLAGRAFPEASALEILFFHSTHCKSCIAVKDEVLPELKEKYKDKIAIVYLNTAVKENLIQLISLAALYEDKEALVPAVLCSDKLLVGKKEISLQLPLIIESSLTKTKTLFLTRAFSQNIIEDKFKTFSLLAISTAGLLDGINPCAFTVIVFFMSFLAFYGYKRTQLVIIGIAYILAVFITYLLIGVGIFGFLYSFKQFHVVIKYFYLAVGSGCFILGVLCIYDYIKFRRTKDVGQSVLQLPKLIKNRIHKVIGGRFREKDKESKKKGCLLFFGALSTGFLVALLEAVCTGQVYLPVIAFVMRVPDLRLRSLVYLFIYNLMFIVPLIIVFLAALWGTTSEQFSQLLKSKFGFIRICMAILFLGLGVLVIWGV